MRRRRGASASIAANPVLIGAATTLVVIVAVFLAYNANQGLPFVPTYDVKAELPDAANIVKGNEVRIAGTRVGVVKDLSTRELSNGKVVAVLDLKLQTTIGNLPVDSTVIVRPRSALGLKYVQITRGSSDQEFQNGATIPLRNAKPEPVELDELFNTFDANTRNAQQTNLREFGNGFAGRGTDINSALGALTPFLNGLIPVAQNLADRRTRLAEFFPALNRINAILAPVAETQATLFGNLDTTFTALAEVSPSIQATIEGGPPALDAAIRSFPIQRAFLANNTALFRDLRPGIAALRVAAPDISEALVVGTPALRRSPALSARLTRTLRTLESVSTNPLVRIGLRTLEDTVGILAPIVNYVKPAQTTCNYLTLFFRNASSLLTEGDANGTWQRFIIIVPPLPAAALQPNNEFGPASVPASTLHQNPYPNTAAPGQPKECEAGNEPYVADSQLVGNPPGDQPLTTELTTRDVGLPAVRRAR
jgi:virulence factor Mce-like protein